MSQASARLRYPEHEARHPWLAKLLDAYQLCDEAARADLARESARRGAPPACMRGCHVCCVGQVVPVSAFEALGLWWFAAEQLEGETRAHVRANLSGHAGHEHAQACPFLVLGACAVYQARPFTCRQHHVFGRPCRPGENLREDRPGDIVNAGQDAARALAGLVIPLYGVAEADVDWRFESGDVQSRSRDLHSLPFENLIHHMDAAARRNSPRHA